MNGKNHCLTVFTESLISKNYLRLLEQVEVAIFSFDMYWETFGHASGRHLLAAWIWLLVRSCRKRKQKCFNVERNSNCYEPLTNKFLLNQWRCFKCLQTVRVIYNIHTLHGQARNRTKYFPLECGLRNIRRQPVVKKNFRTNFFVRSLRREVHGFILIFFSLLAFK